MIRKVITRSRLQEMMDEQGWNDRSMANATGLSPSFIYKLRRGQVGASVASAILLCQVLGLESVHELFWVEVIGLSPIERKIQGVESGETEPIREGQATVGDNQTEMSEGGI